MALPITLLLQALFIGAALESTEGHGWLQQPPGRSSAWRFGFPTPTNFNDNGLNCGGRATQHNTYGGRCGLCGDPFGGQRLHEPGPDNAYALGVIVANYSQGQRVNVAVKVTAPHKGYHEFRLFTNNLPQLGKDASVAVTYNSPNVLLASPDGRTRFDELDTAIVVKLPADITCDACILQWRWRTGNSWGCDGDLCGMGYGPQEEFYGCADVRIAPVAGLPLPIATAAPALPRTSVGAAATTAPAAKLSTSAATEQPKVPTASASTAAPTRASASSSSSIAASATTTQPRRSPPAVETTATTRSILVTSATAALAASTTTRAVGASEATSLRSSPPASAAATKVAVAGSVASELTSTRSTAHPTTVSTTSSAATFSWPRLYDCTGRPPAGDQLKQWCESNCNRIPSYCPPTHCLCVKL